MSTMQLTDKQTQILRFIEEFQRQNGGTPTLREIQKRFGFASSFGANRHIMALEQKGALKRAGGRARSMVLSRPASSHFRIPILGMVPAGHPDHQEASEAGQFLEIDPTAIGISSSARVFGLRVRGESMIGAHILDGDLAILEDRPAVHRDIVAALVDGEVTLKRLIRDGAAFFLKAENIKYPDIIPLRELVIQGVLRTVIRTSPTH
ncbi:MAG: transcriptional repressor LexA [Terrimicrobiaceae bacterium]